MSLNAEEELEDLLTSLIGAVILHRTSVDAEATQTALEQCGENASTQETGPLWAVTTD